MKEIIFTKDAPAPIGPYSQAVKVGNTLYTSGQIAINPIDGQLITDSVDAETRQVMANLSAVLTAAGMDFNDVVKTTIFLSSMNDFALVNQIYATFFDEAAAPARETVEVSVLPKNVNVEISMIAIQEQ